MEDRLSGVEEIGVKTFSVCLLAEEEKGHNHQSKVKKEVNRLTQQR